jgi:two-component system sensor histidine kinase MtrB
VTRRRVAPGRLTLVVTLVAAVLSAAVATGLYALVRDARLRDSLDRARTQAASNTRLLSTLVPDPAGFENAANSLRDLGVPAVLIAADGTSYVSDQQADVAIPADLRTIVSSGQIGTERVDANGTPTLIVGSLTPGGDAQVYFTFPEGAIIDDLRLFRNLLVLGWIAVAVVAFVLGRAAATRIGVLADAEARERRFTADVSHELRTPVAALVSEAEVLASHLGRMPDEARRAAELMVADIARLRRLVEDLTTIARLDTGREPVRRERFDLGELVRGAVSSRGWDQLVQVNSDPVEVESDRSRVDRIAANLIVNGLEHGGGEVTVDVGRDGDHAVVHVSDSGPGIAPEQLAHVFERFFRADAARAGPGSGLGLSIAREGARLLGGEVEAWSTPGVGSRFTLRLAVAEPLHATGSRVADASDDGVEEPEGGTP